MSELYEHLEWPKNLTDGVKSKFVQKKRFKEKSWTLNTCYFVANFLFDQFQMLPLDQLSKSLLSFRILH